MRQTSEFFGEREMALIYIAKRLKEALALESILTRSGLDYLVEADRYHGGIIFRTERVGAFFYVLPEVEPIARGVLLNNGYTPFEALQ